MQGYKYSRILVSLHTCILTSMITNSIKTYREEQGMTQEELAAAIGVSRQTIIAMEKGNYEPSLGLALKLAKHFKVSTEDLFMLK